MHTEDVDVNAVDVAHDDGGGDVSFVLALHHHSWLLPSSYDIYLVQVPFH